LDLLFSLKLITLRKELPVVFAEKNKNSKNSFSMGTRISLKAISVIPNGKQ
jgi:hypothetical protein